jgi:hypothetical protein
MHVQREKFEFQQLESATMSKQQSIAAQCKQNKNLGCTGVLVDAVRVCNSLVI